MRATISSSSVPSSSSSSSSARFGCSSSSSSKTKRQTTKATMSLTMFTRRHNRRNTTTDTTITNKAIQDPSIETTGRLNETLEVEDTASAIFPKIGMHPDREHLVENQRNLGVEVQRQAVAPDDVDVRLVEFAVATTLRTFSTPDLLDLVALKGKLQLAPIFEHVAGEGHGEVEVQSESRLTLALFGLQALNRVELFVGLPLREQMLQRLKRPKDSKLSRSCSIICCSMMRPSGLHSGNPLMGVTRMTASVPGRPLYGSAEVEARSPPVRAPATSRRGYRHTRPCRPASRRHPRPTRDRRHR